MNLATLRFDSRVLDRQTAMTVLLPDGAGPFPVLYLLHGLGGDHESWVRDFDLQHLAERHRLLIVMPEGGRSYYVNDPRPGGQGAMEDHIAVEVVGLVERLFRVRTERTARAVAGLSMGGYGALLLALRHPEMFGAAGALSASLYFGNRPHPRGEVYQTALAAGLPRGEYDCFALASRLADAPVRPRLYFNCGQEDAHRGINHEFHSHLTRLGWAHEYGEFPGRHDRDYWSARLPTLLDFAARATTDMHA